MGIAASVVTKTIDVRNREYSHQVLKLRLSVLPVSVLRQITKVFLDGNKLTSLPPQIEEMKSLLELHCSCNWLRSLPSSLQQLSLNVLRISANQLDTIDYLFNKSKGPGGPREQETALVKSLQSLRVGHNNILIIPEAIQHWNALSSVILNNNEIHALPSGIWNMKNVRVVVLSQNSIKTLPEFDNQEIKIQVLVLTSNRITDVPNSISKCAQMRELYLNDNLIVELPKGVNKLRKMKVLDVSLNNLSESGLLKSNILRNAGIDSLILKPGNDDLPYELTSRQAFRGSSYYSNSRKGLAWQRQGEEEV
eukprot:767358-Hanusia_phi.AAC.2